MATINAFDIQGNQLENEGIPKSTISQVKRMEKRTFPKGEAMDFDVELKKRNTELIVILDAAKEGSTAEALVVAYLLVARIHGVALLHKVCVVDHYQKKGIARGMISRLKEKLEAQGCEKIQLWVDTKRAPARALYNSLGFKLADGTRDYYGPGRDALKLELNLNYVW